MNERIYFVPKLFRRLIYICLVTIPLFGLVLYYNFNVLGLILVIVISIILILLVYFLNTMGIRLKENSITYYSFRKKIILVKDIQSIELGKNGSIVIKMDNNKKITRAGYIDFISQTPSNNKNIKLIDKINKKYFIKKKYGQPDYLKYRGYKIRNK